MSYVRTAEHRALRAEMIRQWKPWERSTGPKTVEGKQASALRGYKGNLRGKLKDIRNAIRDVAIQI